MSLFIPLTSQLSGKEIFVRADAVTSIVPDSTVTAYGKATRVNMQNGYLMVTETADEVVHRLEENVLSPGIDHRALGYG